MFAEPVIVEVENVVGLAVHPKSLDNGSASSGDQVFFS
jgi:hypothetical protein